MLLPAKRGAEASVSRICAMLERVWGLRRGRMGCWRKNGGAGKRVWGAGERVWGAGERVWGSEERVWGTGERVWGVPLLLLHLSISMGFFRNYFLHICQAVLSAVTCWVR